MNCELVISIFDSADSCVGKRRQESSDPAQNFLLIPSLTSDYVPVTVGHGISPEYDADYAGWQTLNVYRLADLGAYLNEVISYCGLISIHICPVSSYFDYRVLSCFHRQIFYAYKYINGNFTYHAGMGNWIFVFSVFFFQMIKKNFLQTSSN